VGIRDTRPTIYGHNLIEDRDQVVNLGEPALVHTCYGSADAVCGEVTLGDPKIAGLEVRAELRGPELPQAIPHFHGSRRDVHRPVHPRDLRERSKEPMKMFGFPGGGYPEPNVSWGGMPALLSIPPSNSQEIDDA